MTSAGDDFGTPEYWARVRRSRNADREELPALPPPAHTTRDPWPTGTPMPDVLVKFGTLAQAYGWEVRYGYAIARVRTRRKVDDAFTMYEYDKHTVVCGIRRKSCIIHLSWHSDSGIKPWGVNNGYLGILTEKTLPVFLGHTVLKGFVVMTDEEIANALPAEVHRQKLKNAAQAASAKARTPKKKERAVN